jgi:hypothetical protein
MPAGGDAAGMNLSFYAMVRDLTRQIPAFLQTGIAQIAGSGPRSQHRNNLTQQEGRTGGEAGAGRGGAGACAGSGMSR